MTRQLAVPKCDGPILLLLDILTCCVGTLPRKALGQGGLLPLTYFVGCGISIPSRQLATPPLCVALQLFPVLTAWHIPSLTSPIQRRPGMRAWHMLLTSPFAWTDYFRPLCCGGFVLVELPHLLTSNITECAAVDMFWFDPTLGLFGVQKMCSIHPSIHLVTVSMPW